MPSTYVASEDISQSRVSKDYVRGLHCTFKVPQDVHFYAPWDDARADQTPAGMIAINESLLEAGLRFPLHPTISHLLVAWNQSITQITPNC